MSEKFLKKETRTSTPSAEQPPPQTVLKSSRGRGGAGGPPRSCSSGNRPGDEPVESANPAERPVNPQNHPTDSLGDPKFLQLTTPKDKLDLIKEIFQTANAADRDVTTGTIKAPDDPCRERDGDFVYDKEMQPRIKTCMKACVGTGNCGWSIEA